MDGDSQRLDRNFAHGSANAEPEPESDLGALYRRHRGDIVRFVAKRFGNGPPDPEDVAQVAFEKYAAYSSSVAVMNPRAFLMRSACNYVLDQKRQQSIRADYARELQDLSGISDNITAGRVLEAREHLELLEAAIARLDPRSRELLLLSRVHGLSSAEIARRQGCSPTLVKAIVARALVACHRALDEGDEP